MGRLTMPGTLRRASRKTFELTASLEKFVWNVAPHRFLSSVILERRKCMKIKTTILATAFALSSTLAFAQAGGGGGGAGGAGGAAGAGAAGAGSASGSAGGGSATTGMSGTNTAGSAQSGATSTLNPSGNSNMNTSPSGSTVSPNSNRLNTGR